MIGFKEGQQADIKNVLAGILQLGNVAFMNAGGAQVVDMDGKRPYFLFFFLVLCFA